MHDRLLCAIEGYEITKWNALQSTGTAGGAPNAWNLIAVRMEDEIVGNFSDDGLIIGRLGAEWLLSGVYGLSSVHYQQEFWEELFSLRSRWKGPWVVGGDFKM